MSPELLADADVAARRLGVSKEAIELVRRSDVIDLHVDSDIPRRLFGYDLARRHGRWPFFGVCFGHLDLPRALEGGLSGAMWSITTNPVRSRAGRWRVFLENLDRVSRFVSESGGRIALARNHAEYRHARAAGAHACMLAIQGGNALEAAPDGPRSIPSQAITRVTLVHLTSSTYGASSSPLSWLTREKRLTNAGIDAVRQLDEARIFVDLAHLHPCGFWDVVRVHDKSQPLIATHTGVSGVRPHWRNLDDAQIKAIADTGGTIGIIFAKHFLQRAGGPRDGRMIVEHIEHVIRVAGEDFVSIGSDYDGLIVPPHDLRSATTYPRLVQHMLDRGFSTERVGKVLGGNFLRCFRQLRPD